MPAAATARKPAPRAARTSTRRAPRPVHARAARTAPPRPARRAPRPAPRLVPVAVGRTAVAVGGIADSWMVLRLTRSRLWIGLLGTLLVGIVALNVMALSFNASSSKTAGISDELRRENSALRAEIAGGLSNERVQAAAAQRGLVVPEPGAIRYLDPSQADAAAAAQRLRNGEITLGTVAQPLAPVTPVIPPPETALEPVATEPATTDPAVADPAATTAPDTAATTAPATAAASGEGGGLTVP